MFFNRLLIVLLGLGGMLHASAEPIELFQRLFSVYVEHGIRLMSRHSYACTKKYVPCNGDPKRCLQLVTYTPVTAEEQHRGPFGFILFHVTEDGSLFDTYCTHDSIPTCDMLATTGDDGLNKSFGSSFTYKDILWSFSEDDLRKTKFLISPEYPCHWSLNDIRTTIVHKNQIPHTGADGRAHGSSVNHLRVKLSNQ